MICPLMLASRKFAMFNVNPGSTVVKNQPARAGDTRDSGLIPNLGRSPGVGNGNALQYSCLENPMDRGAWQNRVHGVSKSWPKLRVPAPPL